MTGTVGILMMAAAAACGVGEPPVREQAAQVPAASEVDGTLPADLPALMRSPPPVSDEVQDSVFEHAARAAWQFMERHRVARTGLVAAQPEWPYPTVWDIGSTLAATHAARALGYIDDDGYRARVRPLLETLQSVRLYEDAAYGRNYAAATGELVNDAQQSSENGTGYSALDLGRLLVWLRIVAESEPTLAEAARAVAERIDEDRVLDDGYMYGEQIMPGEETADRYQEGRIGYEQYAARGFALWDMDVEEALRVSTNLDTASIFGRPIAADSRGLDRLTSEPLVLFGLELGLPPDMHRIAQQTLAAQAARHERTGQITIASEDALNVEPHFFYYYCVYCSGKPFVINIHTPGVELDAPRWVSTKAAFAWHALMPSAYTWLAVEHVQPALDEQGWASGVLEENAASTESYTLNTAAVILEAAAYRRLGGPFHSSGS